MLPQVCPSLLFRDWLQPSVNYWYSFNFLTPYISPCCKVEEDKPEDCIPDLPENEQAREFLSKAPTKGLWMPLGKEVKVMKCKARLFLMANIWIAQWLCSTYSAIIPALLLLTPSFNSLNSIALWCSVIMPGWRCKSFGHRTGDRECPMFVSGNQTSERFRMVLKVDHQNLTDLIIRTQAFWFL